MPGPAREDDDAAFFQMPDGAPPNEWLGHLVHLDRGLHARVDFLFFQRILQSERIDHRGQHSHVIGGNAVHVLGLIGHAAKEIAAAHHDRELHSQLVHIGQLRRDFVDARRIHTKALIGSQGFSGNLEQNAFEGRGFHSSANYVAPALALSLPKGPAGGREGVPPSLQAQKRRPQAPGITQLSVQQAWYWRPSHSHRPL